MHRTKHLTLSAAIAGLTSLAAVAAGLGGDGLAGATTPTEPTVTETTIDAPTTDGAVTPVTAVPPSSVPVPPPMSEPGAERAISVIGTGTASVTPDMATVWMGVQTRAATTQEALDTVTEKANALVTTLEAVGVAREDIQTSGLSLWPVYGNDGTTVQGYDASTNVTVTVRDLARAGEIIDAAQGFVGDGFTLGGINFESSDPEAAMQEARVEAIDNARIRAEQYAAAAGVAVGEVLRIVEVGAVDLTFSRSEGADMAAAAALPIEPGQQQLTASVTVVFAIA